MTLPFVFANLSGNVPSADLDTTYNAVAAMAVTQCTASGVNAIALTQTANQTTVTAYQNYQLFSFPAVSTSTGSVTINVNSVGAKPLYLPDGVTQAGSGNITSGSIYIIVYNSALNSGLGGFQLINQQSFGSINIQVIMSTQTYTPTAGMVFCTVELIGGGGAGGSTPSTDGSHNAVAGGGGAGAYVRKTFSSSTIGASQSVTIGAGGTPGAAGANPGGNGGNSTFGALLTANGGSGGAAGISGTSNAFSASGAGGTASGGDINITGGRGTAGYMYSVGLVRCGEGGGNPLAPATGTPVSATNIIAGLGYGGGGTGNWSLISTSAAQGAAGAAGVCIITEYIF